MTNLNELYNRFLNGESITKLSKEIDVSRETLTKKFIKNCGYVRQSKLNISTKKDNFIKFYDFLYKDSNYTNRLNRKYEKYTKNLPS